MQDKILIPLDIYQADITIRALSNYACTLTSSVDYADVQKRDLESEIAGLRKLNKELAEQVADLTQKYMEAKKHHD